MFDSEIFPAYVKTQHDKVLYLLRRAGKSGVTCSEFLQTSLAAAYRARMSELRAKGYVISCELHEGGKSIYRLMSEPMKFIKESNGQLAFA